MAVRRIDAAVLAVLLPLGAGPLVACSPVSAAPVPSPGPAWLGVAASRPEVMVARFDAVLSVSVDDGRSWRVIAVPAGVTEARVGDDGTPYAFGEPG